MSPPALLAPLHEHRARLLPVGLALTLTYAYFVGEPAWNQNSRLALTRAMVEQHTTIIDDYHVTTGDKSYRDGHFYCDKAPGASWVAEYGDPDDPEDWEFISKYSPYQNISSLRRYPPVLITTSTRDDRVHPGHARKMTAALEAAGQPVRYYENIEGGHAGAADNAQTAFRAALIYEFLLQTLQGS